MSRKGGPSAEDRRLEELLDRIEDRLRDAPEGFHSEGSPAEAGALAGAHEAVRGLWSRWNGIELAHGEAELLDLGRQTGATRDALDEGRIEAGDRVVGERGRDLLVLPADPWEEGADVVLVEEGGDRSPEAYGLERLVLGWMAELTVLYDKSGEFRDELYGDDGELLPEHERRMLRKRLDVDPDAPRPRFRLAQLLRRGGDPRAAVQELKAVLHRAPEYAWAHQELGRALLDLGDREGARRAFASAAQRVPDAPMRAHFLAWAALASDADAQPKARAAVRDAHPTFCAEVEAGAEQLVERGDLTSARELLKLGLAACPDRVGLLDLRNRLANPTADP